MKILYLFVIIFIISCSQTSIFRMEGPDDFLNKYANNTLTIDNTKKSENNIENYFIIRLKKWKKDKFYSKKYNCPYYERWRSLYNPNTNITDENTLGIELCSHNRTCKYDKNLIYVGKWYYLKKINKNIRFIACYDEGFGGFYRYFETMDDGNRNIPHMSLNVKIAKDILDKSNNFIKRESNAKTISTIQWFEKYGYNAYVDLKTGEIKQAKE